MIYVCSDIHGNLDRYKKLIEKINKEDTLYILGDVIDRGENGIEILKDIMKRDNIILLSGNHEDFMLSYLKIKNNEPNCNFIYNPHNWLLQNNGGKITLEKYLNEDEDTQKNIYNFLKSLPIMVLLEINGNKFHLTHSGTIIKDFNSYNLTTPKIFSREDLSIFEIFEILWKSPYKFSEYLPIETYPKEFTCIVGHVPVQLIQGKTNYKIYKEDNLIDIDGGCAFSEIEKQLPKELKTSLSYLCLDTMKSYYII